MSTVFVEFSKPFMMPGGGMAGTGETPRSIRSPPRP
jgi:hypothetical protein